MKLTLKQLIDEMVGDLSSPFFLKTKSEIRRRINTLLQVQKEELRTLADKE